MGGIKIHLKIRNLLANRGKELTPAEAEVLTDKIESIIDFVTPDVASEIAEREDVDEDVKEVILHIYELKEQGRL